jgi:uncharacterized protein
LIYLDTSVLAPFYWTELLSSRVDELLASEETALSQLVQVELYSAISRRVRMGEIAQVDARAIVERFQRDLDESFF